MQTIWGLKMRYPILYKSLALLSLLHLLVLAPAQGACTCEEFCEDAHPCEDMTAEMSAEGHTAHSANDHLQANDHVQAGAHLQECHHSSVAPSDWAVLPRGNELQSTVALSAIPPGLTADRVARPAAPLHGASRFHADRSSDRYILFASFLS